MHFVKISVEQGNQHFLFEMVCIELQSVITLFSTYFDKMHGFLKL